MIIFSLVQKRNVKNDELVYQILLIVLKTMFHIIHKNGSNSKNFQEKDNAFIQKISEYKKNSKCIKFDIIKFFEDFICENDVINSIQRNNREELQLPMKEKARINEYQNNQNLLKQEQEFSSKNFNSLENCIHEIENGQIEQKECNNIFIVLDRILSCIIYIFIYYHAIKNNIQLFNCDLENGHEFEEPFTLQKYKNIFIHLKNTNNVQQLKSSKSMKNSQYIKKSQIEINTQTSQNSQKSQNPINSPNFDTPLNLNSNDSPIEANQFKKILKKCNNY